LLPLCSQNLIYHRFIIHIASDCRKQYRTKIQKKLSRHNNKHANNLHLRDTQIIFYLLKPFASKKLRFKK